MPKIFFLALVFFADSAFSQGVTKAMLEQQYASTCTVQAKRVNPTLVFQCQQWRSQIDAMKDTGDPEETAAGSVPVQPTDFTNPATPQKQYIPPVNQCISLRTNQWGARQFFNGCDFTVNIAWCTEEQGNAFSCKGGRINGQALNFVNPNTEQAVGGKNGKVHFVACRGGPSSGVYASIRDGNAECRQ